MILSALLGDAPSSVRIMFVLTITYFLACMFVDPIVVIMILTPIFKPAIAAAGLDNILCGIIHIPRSARKSLAKCERFAPRTCR